MPVTFTTNYTEIFAEDIVEKIQELEDENFDLEAMLEFIDERSTEDFVKYYEEYVRCGEAIGYEVVDLLIDEMDFESIVDCDERYQGAFDNAADFAEYWVEEALGVPVPEEVVVDWEETWDRNLYRDFTIVGKEHGYKNAHVFADR